MFVFLVLELTVLTMQQILQNWKPKIFSDRKFEKPMFAQLE